MKFIVAIIATVALVLGLVALTHVRHPWLSEQAALQLACPLIGPNSPADLAMQCKMYSRFGVIWDDMSGSGGVGVVCQPGRHLETSRLAGRVCIQDAAPDPQIPHYAPGTEQVPGSCVGVACPVVDEPCPDPVHQRRHGGICTAFGD